MPAISLQERWILQWNIDRELRDDGWKFRHIVFRHLLNEVPLGTIRQLIERTSEHVETIRIDAYGFRDDISEMLISGYCSSHTLRLKKLRIDSFNGSTVLSALVSTPSVLEELEFHNVWFSSSENVERFLATSETLKTLGLTDVHIERVDETTTEAEIALAFRRGLQLNQKLRLIKFQSTRDCLLMRECLVGFKYCSVRELSLDLTTSGTTLHFFHPLHATGCQYSHQTLGEVRELLSGTSSIKKLLFHGGTPLAEIFLGLKSNSSIKEINFVLNKSLTGSMDDATLASAIHECSSNNKALRILKIDYELLGVGLGPQAREALANGLPRWDSLQEVRVYGDVVPAEVLRHVAKLKRVCLEHLGSPDWELLSLGMQNAQENKLQILDLRRNALTTQNLQNLLPNLSCISELSLNGCSVAFESIPAICDFIRNTPLKKLGLGSNPIGSQGAAAILVAVSNSGSMELLELNGPCLNISEDDNRMAQRINLNECHESLRTLLVGSPLISLDVMQYPVLEAEATRSVAAGLRGGNATLTSIKLPWLNLAFVDVLGVALTHQNCVVKSLEVNGFIPTTGHGRRDGLSMLESAEEEAVMLFIRMMPRMKHLTCIKGLFDFKPSERINQALVSALKENTVLKEIQACMLPLENGPHICQTEIVQFYLQLNRLGRHHYLDAPESKSSVPVGALPHLFARLSGPEYSSHLYYFLRCTSPDVLAGQDKRQDKPYAHRKRNAAVLLSR